jgi:hypothetical protein
VLSQQIYERWTAEQISALRGASGGVEPGEVAAMMHGIIAGFRDALRLSRQALRTGGRPEDLGKVEMRAPAITARTFGLRVSKVVDSPIDAELQRINANIPLPNKRTSFDGVPVNFRAWPEVWVELRRLEGHELKHPAYGLGAKELLDQVVKGEHPLSAIYERRPDGDGPGSKGSGTWTVHSDGLGQFTLRFS